MKLARIRHAIAIRTKIKQVRYIKYLHLYLEQMTAKIVATMEIADRPISPA